MSPLRRPRVSLRARAQTAEERFDLLVQNVQDYALFMMTTSGVIVSWNVGVRRLLGYEEAELLGRPFSILFAPEDDPEQAAATEMSLAVSTGRAEDERRHLRKDGGRFWAFGILTALRDPSGELRGFAKIMRDITERKLAEEEREQLLQRERHAREDAERANGVRDEFLATLSHELRTPLNAILGWAGILQSAADPAEMIPRGLAAIERSARQQARLIGDLLELPQLLSGRVRLEPQRVDVVGLVHDVVDGLVPQAGTRSVTVDAEAGIGSVSVRGDRNRLQQVLLNLLGNAIKFTAPDGQIHVRLSRDGGDVVIAVTDNGHGISSGFLPHVFEPFRSEDATTRRGHTGLGLGLAIVRQIIDLHSGTVAVHSDGPGRGATFTVRLPIVTGARPVEHTDARQAFVSLSGLRVLVIDDDDACRDMTLAALEMAGATVTGVRSAPDGLADVARSRPDVIVCDLQMPGSDGFDFIKALRLAHGETPPALALTAHARPDDRLRALTAGFQVHLGKPVDIDALIGALHALSAGSAS